MLKPNTENFERLTKAVKHDFRYELVKEPRIAVTDVTSDSNESHVVNVKSLLCSCDDFEYNCIEGVYCKHIWFLVLKQGNMI